MFATIISILLSLYLYFYGSAWSPTQLFPFSIAASAILLSFGAAALLVSFLPVQKGEQNITPRLSELFKKDIRINLGMAFLFSLPLIIIGVTFLPHPVIPTLILLGMGIDVLYLLIRRIMDYLNPFKVTDFLKNEGFYAVDNSNDTLFCRSVEACSEIAIKSLQRHNSALAKYALNSLELMSEKFLASSKGRTEALDYVLIFLFEHLEMIYMHALDKRLEMVAGDVITSLTKLAIYAARIDLSLATLPLYYMDKLSKIALERGAGDVAIKATSGFLSVAQSLGSVKDIQYQDLKPSFITMITSMDTTAKEMFKKDKTIRIALLVHPLKQLAELIENEPFKNHQDKEAIALQIKLVLDEFSALEAVLATMPPIPSISQEEIP